MTTHMARRPFKRETNTSWPWKCVSTWCNHVWRHKTHACMLELTYTLKWSRLSDMHTHTHTKEQSVMDGCVDTNINTDIDIRCDVKHYQLKYA